MRPHIIQEELRMRRIAAVLTAALVILSLSAALAARQEKRARGKVTAISGNAVTIDVKGQAMTFAVDASTRTTAPGGSTKTKEAERTGAKLTIADFVKVGDNVEISYVESGATLLAKSVRAGISAPAGTSADAAAPATKRLEGVVSDVSGSKLTIKPQAGDATTFVVEPDIRVSGEGLGTLARDKQAKGAKLTLTEAVSTGDTVEVSYKTVGEAKHATGVRVLRKKT
jgi:hypothetical protein